jgi:anti-sigma factor ChrR (cupin superfamily)
MQTAMQTIVPTGSILVRDLLNKDIDKVVLNWEPYSADERKGVEIVRLYDARENNQGSAAALLRYAPGAKVARHVHQGYELIFILKGCLINDSGVHRRGTLEICPPGSNHALSSGEGCTFLVVWEQPVVVEQADTAH